MELLILDVLGNQITTLVDKKQKPGSYEVEFDTGRLTNGIYFYQMITGKLKQTKIMILD